MKGRAFAQPPKAINCPLCNGKYFKHSFQIHFDQCKLLHQQTHENCRRCHREIHIDEIMMHQEHCFSQENTPSNLSENQVQYEVESMDVNSDNDYRVQCKYCYRKFNPDRIEKHESICNKLKPEVRSPLLRSASTLRPTTGGPNIKATNSKQAHFQNPKKTVARVKRKPAVPTSNNRMKNNLKLNPRTRKLVTQFESLPEDIQMQILSITNSFYKLTKK